MSLFFLSYAASAVAPFVPGSSFWSWGSVLGIWLGIPLLLWSTPFVIDASEEQRRSRVNAYSAAYVIISLVVATASLVDVYFSEALQAAQPDTVPDLLTLTMFIVLLPSALLAWLTPDVGGNDWVGGRKPD